MVDEVRLHRVAVLLPYLDFLSEVGAPVESGLGRAGLPHVSIEDANNFVPSDRFYAFVSDMARRERLEQLGYLVGKHQGANCADPRMVALLRASPTMQSGLSRAIDLINSTISCCNVGLRRCPDGQSVEFFHKPSCDAGSIASEQIAWFGVMTLLGIVRVFAGPQWRPTRIGVAAAHVPGRGAAEEFPDTRIELKRGFSYISIPAGLLCRPPPAAGKAGTAGLETDYDPIDSSLIGGLRQIMRSYMSQGLQIATAAEFLDTSVRSLQRALRNQGTSFSMLLEEARFDFARRALADLDVPIDDLSRALGYEHHTNFSRAFRRIAGVTPRQYRRILSRGLRVS